MVEWRPVIGYETLYAVSNDGRVRGLLYRNGWEPHELRAHKNERWGYWQVILYKDRRRRMHYVHHLVATAFIGPVPPDHEINHRDLDKDNNTVQNLEFILSGLHQALHGRFGIA